jgi:hypothetical protein
MKILMYVGTAPVLVDDEDYERCKVELWYTDRRGYLCKYGRPTTRLHNFVFGRAPSGLVTDHIDRNKLNNQKHNLRFTTLQHNRINTTSPSKELRHIRQRTNNTWLVQIKRNKKAITLGTYTSIKDAVEIRDAYLKKEGLTDHALS